MHEATERRGHLDRAQSGSRPAYEYEYRDRHPGQEEADHEDEDDPGRMIGFALRPKPTLGGFLDPLSGKISGRVKKKPVMPLLRTAIQNSFRFRTKSYTEEPLPHTPRRLKPVTGARRYPVVGPSTLIPVNASASASSSTLLRTNIVRFGNSSDRGPLITIPAKQSRLHKPRRKTSWTSPKADRDDPNTNTNENFSLASASRSDDKTSPRSSASKRDPGTVLAEARRTAHRMLGPIPSIDGKPGREGPLSIPDTYHLASTHTRTTGNDGTVDPTSQSTLNDHSGRNSTCPRGSIRGPIDDRHRPTRKIYKLPRRIKGSSSASAPASLGILREDWRGNQGEPGSHQEKENMIAHPTADERYSTFCRTGPSEGPDDLLENSKERKEGWRTISEMTTDMWRTSTSRLGFLSGEKDAGEPKVIWSRRSKEGDGAWEVGAYEMEEMLDEGIQDEDIQNGLWEVDASEEDGLSVELEGEAEFLAVRPSEPDFADDGQDNDPEEILKVGNKEYARGMEIKQGYDVTQDNEEQDNVDAIPKIAPRSFELNGYWRRVEGKWVLVPRPSRNGSDSPREQSPIPRFEEVEAM